MRGFDMLVSRGRCSISLRVASGDQVGQQPDMIGLLKPVHHVNKGRRYIRP
jgi:hypothetical protein